MLVTLINGQKYGDQSWDAGEVVADVPDAVAAAWIKAKHATVFEPPAVEPTPVEPPPPSRKR